MSVRMPIDLVLGVSNFPPGDLVSGTYGHVDLQIDSLLPHRGLAVRVQLTRETAECVMRWVVGPDGEMPGDDVFLDELIDLVRRWVATFPLPMTCEGVAPATAGQEGE